MTEGKTEIKGLDIAKRLAPFLAQQTGIAVDSAPFDKKPKKATSDAVVSLNKYVTAAREGKSQETIIALTDELSSHLVRVITSTASERLKL